MTWRTHACYEASEITQTRRGWQLSAVARAGHLHRTHLHRPTNEAAAGDAEGAEVRDDGWLFVVLLVVKQRRLGRILLRASKRGGHYFRDVICLSTVLSFMIFLRGRNYCAASPAFSRPFETTV
jgi:hypothetical protein